MMTVKLQVTILLALFIALISIVNMIRRKNLELAYALSWLFVLAAVAVFALFPRFMVVMAHFLGIDSPVNMIFFLGFCFSLVIIYTLTVSLSRMSIRIRKLTQIIANNEVKSVTIVRMEVPCCGGIELAVKKVLQASGKFIPWQIITLGRDGTILD